MLFAYLPVGLAASERSVYVCQLHGWHSTDPQAEYDPGAQSEQAVAPADSDRDAVPRPAQSASRWVSEYVPGAHLSVRPRQSGDAIPEHLFTRLRVTRKQI